MPAGFVMLLLAAPPAGFVMLLLAAPPAGFVMLLLAAPPPPELDAVPLPLVGLDVSPFLGVLDVTFCWDCAAFPAFGLPILVLFEIILVLFPKAFDSCCTFPMGGAIVPALLVLFDYDCD
jgi:hypothetical protein